MGREPDAGRSASVVAGRVERGLAHADEAEQQLDDVLRERDPERGDRRSSRRPSIDSPRTSRCRKASIAAGRRLARQRRQQDDAQRHADHADRDLEDREREVEHRDRARRRASTRGWS